MFKIEVILIAVFNFNFQVWSESESEDKEEEGSLLADLLEQRCEQVHRGVCQERSQP